MDNFQNSKKNLKNNAVLSEQICGTSWPMGLAINESKRHHQK